MTDRLNWTELRRAVMLRTGASEKEAHVFLDAFMEQLKEALRSEKQVKIIGLGTFRLQSVAPRKSVSIKTGEPITIKEYNKIVFSPEVGIKELIDNSRSEPDTEEFNPIRKLGQQADEIVDILADLGQDPRTMATAPVSAPVAPEEQIVSDVPTPAEEPETPKEEQVETPKEEQVETPKEELVETPKEEQVETPKEEQVETPKEEQVETPKEEQVETPKEEQVETPKEDSPSTTEDAISDTTTPTPPTVEPVKNDPPTVVSNPPLSVEKSKSGKKRKYHFLRDTLICTICLLLLLLGGYFFLREQLTRWVDSLSNNQNPTAEVVDTVANHSETDIQVLPTNDSAATQPLRDTLTLSEIEAPVYTDFIATEKLREGSRLSWLAYRYYGNKELWVYIYDANKEHLDNPNQIRIGTTIRIPQLTPEQKDTTNLQTKALIESLRVAANSHTH